MLNYQHSKNQVEWPIQFAYNDFMMDTFRKQMENYQGAFAKFTEQIARQEPSRRITMTSSGTSSAKRPKLNVITSLPSTEERVRQIQARLASNTRAEFSSVIAQLNASQGKPGKQESGGIAGRDGVQ